MHRPTADTHHKRSGTRISASPLAINDTHARARTLFPLSDQSSAKVAPSSEARNRSVPMLEPYMWYWKEALRGAPLSRSAKAVEVRRKGPLKGLLGVDPSTYA